MTCDYNKHGICTHPDKIGDRNITDDDCDICKLVDLHKKTSCRHKGSARSCCVDLHICRKLKKDCVESLIKFTQYKSETDHPELFQERIVCCETCEYNTIFQLPSQES